MTTSQLIHHLQQLPPGMPEVVRAYKDGYNPALRLVPRTLAPHPGSRHEWNGQYAKADALSGDAFEAVELFGDNTESEK
jgi:hypothetical protein